MEDGRYIYIYFCLGCVAMKKGHFAFFVHTLLVGASGPKLNRLFLGFLVTCVCASFYEPTFLPGIHVLASVVQKLSQVDFNVPFVSLSQCL